MSSNIYAGTGVMLNQCLFQCHVNPMPLTVMLCNVNCQKLWSKFNSVAQLSVVFRRLCVLKILRIQMKSLPLSSAQTWFVSMQIRHVIECAILTKVCLATSSILFLPLELYIKYL